MPLAQVPIPAIRFETDEFVRRSMTLNSMRMATEYFAAGSPRLLEMVEQRLAAGQSDVVHDALVYTMRKLLDYREEERELRLLRAESVAAYLGLDQTAVNDLFLAVRLDPKRIADRITAGAAGAVRRQIDVAAVIESQVRLLRPGLQSVRVREKEALWLLDAIVAGLDGNAWT